MRFEVKSINIRSRSTIFKFLIIGFLTVMGIILIMSLSNQQGNMIVLTTVLGTMLILLFPLLLVFTLTSKVIFDTDKVTRVSIFGKKVIYIREIKTHGIFIQSKYRSRLINTNEINEKEMINSYWIFLSDSSTFDLNKFRLPSNIRIEYRAEVYKKINDWLNNNQRLAKVV